MRRLFNSLNLLLVGVFVALGLLLGSSAMNGKITGSVLSDKTERRVVGIQNRGGDENDNSQDKKERVEVQTREQEQEQEQEQEVEVKEGLGEAKIKAKVKIKNTVRGASLKSDNVEAKSKFPVSVNSKTSELTVTTPAGSRVVTILPDQAVANMLREEKFATASSVTLVENENNQLAYRIRAEKSKRFLGIFKVAIPVISEVSAQDGAILTTSQTTLSRILDLLSF